MNTHEIKQRFKLLSPFLTENLRRRVAAAEAMAIGYGGISIVSRETGVSRGAIALGCEELRHPDQVDETRIRRKGGGRKQAVAKDPTLKGDLETLIEPPEGATSPLRWTSKSVRSLASELNRMDHKISHNRVADLLHELGYSLRGNQKTLEGVSASDRDLQFGFINQEARRYQSTGQPVVFVDIKKREMMNGVAAAPPSERISDPPEFGELLSEEVDNALPVDAARAAETQWVSVDIDQDTAIFAVDSIRRWWHSMGRSQHPGADKLLITVDSGGSNGYRIKLWKEELQKLARELSLTITVSHLPPGTSKWSRIEHRLFSFHSQNWHSRPQVSHRVIVNMIALPESGATLEASPGRAQQPLSEPPVGANRVFHREWNYTV